MAVQRVAVRHLHDATDVHHRDSVTDVPDDAQVMGDKKVGEIKLTLQFDEQVEDLRLNGDVQRGYRLVGDHQSWIQGQGPGNDNPLSLPAAELVRETVDVLGQETHDRHHLPHLFVTLSARQNAVDERTLADEPPHRPPWVQGGVGILKDNLHVPSEALHGVLIVGHDVCVVEIDLSLRGFLQPENTAAERGLSATGFPDQPQGLPFLDDKIHAIHRLDRQCGSSKETSVRVKVFLQVSDDQKISVPHISST